MENDEREKSGSKKESSKSNASEKLSERALGPAADAFGQEVAPAGRDAGKLVRKIFSPLAALVWGIDRIEEWVSEELTAKIKKIPVDQRATPDVRIVGPLIESMRFSANESEVREMFTNLLASDVDARTKGFVHPSFVQIVREFSSNDAKVFKTIAEPGFVGGALVEVIVSETQKDSKIEMLCVVMGAVDLCWHDLSTVGNLRRYGLIDLIHDVEFSSYHEAYEEFLASDKFKKFKEDCAAKNLEWESRFVGIRLTPLGQKFRNACLRTSSEIDPTLWRNS